ncbi:hypothetical protein [Desulfosporosinus fructosivorans]|uniref:hypothetical protein n=1 Tax=Desulfosporosinus fructosivorans TaxID=2018669 RepID=UPI00130DB1F1|nr:hypothetical protein [Desulfosporosinus fructosivorans]
MEPMISFAEKKDKEDVQQLLWEDGLGISGDIEDHVLLRVEGKVGAVGKLFQTSPN